MGKPSPTSRALLVLALVATGSICLASQGEPDGIWLHEPLEIEQNEHYVAIETFPVPSLTELDAAMRMRLEGETGVAGTEILGIRLKIGMPTGYRFDSVKVNLADALFLVKENSFLGKVGSFLSRVAQFLLFGKLVNAGSGLEIPAVAWTALFDSPSIHDEPVTLHTRRDARFKASDQNTTDHGDFVVCRFLLAANTLTELVDVQVIAKNPAGDTLRYTVPRLKLPATVQPGRHPAKLAVWTPRFRIAAASGSSSH